MNKNLLLLLAVVVLGGAVLWYALRSRPSQLMWRPLIQPAGPIQLDLTYAGDEKITFVGGQNCKECHEVEYSEWLGSHHDMAMDVANEQTVLGDFNDSTFENYGTTWRFYRRDGRFYVHTDDQAGQPREYEVLYVFGFDPLQQYIVETQPGVLQMLPTAWGADPLNSDENLHWFHLYPDERIKPDDELHWTGVNQSYNFMCAECHSTNLKKKYNPEKKNYGTTFSEIDVSCEACHGPGSEHVKWARADEAGRSYPTNTAGCFGLVISLKNAEGSSWVYDPSTKTYKRTKPLQNRVGLDTCARCHSRHSVISEDYVYGQSIHDTHRVSLLEEHLYHAGGQIEDEVYVYGSFVQSKMHHEGVRCIDCHNPHSLKLEREGNATCTHCHIADYDSPKHFFDHAPGTPGAMCVDCHMIQRYYMVTDPRRDHSFRIPRPDLSVKLGLDVAPNACNDCHNKEDETAQWAADWVEKWYGPTRKQPLAEHYAVAFNAAHRQDDSGEKLLNDQLAQPNLPAIARATAIHLLRRYPSQKTDQQIAQALKHDDSMVRLSALAALVDWEPRRRWMAAADLLDDPVRGVRVEAARVLMAESRQYAQGALAGKFNSAVQEFIRVQRDNADRASSHLNLAVMHVERGEAAKAETAYLKAIELEPYFLPTYVNLADLYRMQRREADCLRIIRDGLKISPDTGVLHHILGLALVRQGKTDAAMTALNKATALEPNNRQFAYVYAVALNSTGRPNEALTVLDKMLASAPRDQQVLQAAALFCRDAGMTELAIGYAKRLLATSPGNPGYQALLQQLQQSQ